jgi:hypothetical protein
MTAFIPGEQWGAGQGAPPPGRAGGPRLHRRPPKGPGRCYRAANSLLPATLRGPALAGNKRRPVTGRKIRKLRETSLAELGPQALR